MKKAIALAAAAILAAAMPAMARHKKQQEPEVPPPVAQSGPSFEETRDFIVKYLSEYGGDDTDLTRPSSISDVNISNACLLTFTKNQFQADYKKGTQPFPYDSGTITVPMEVAWVQTDTYNGLVFYTSSLQVHPSSLLRMAFQQRHMPKATTM